jgi:hypothetical protein
MSRSPDTPATLMNAEVLAERLDALLGSFTAAYRRAANMAAQHREAIRQADGAGVARATDAQSRGIEELATLEQRRRELVALCCTRFAPLASRRATAITLTDLCQCVPVADRPRLLTKAAELKELVTSVNEQTRTIKAATVSLVAHMEGLMRQVGRQLSHSGTYTKRGYVEAGGAVVSALDLRS